MLRKSDSRRRWSNSSIWNPKRLAILFTIILILIKLALGAFIISKYRTVQIISNGEIGSVYIDTLLAPYALTQIEFQGDGTVNIDKAFRSVAVDRPNVVLRIWRPDGRLFYSTFVSDTVELHDRVDLEVAISGRFVSKLETEGMVEPGFPLAFPYMEIYAPIHDPMTGELVAVGELYQDATGLLRDRTFVERTVIAGLTLVTMGVLVMLALSFRLAEQLQVRLEAERKITDLNEQLREQANKARLDAVHANEQVLDLIGAELHDGPVQLLGLVSLMHHREGSKLPDGTTSVALLDKVMTELRTISSGLILPELDDLSADEVVSLAVGRHKALVGEDVIVHAAHVGPDLDLPRKICLFRIVQEGLSNAVRHGDGQPPRLTVSEKDGQIVIELLSTASPEVVADKPDVIRKLGLQGMRRRLDAFGGRVVLQSCGRDTQLRATLPIQSAHEIHGRVS